MPEAAVLTSNTPLELPRLFGRLVLLKLIARGGMGDVYLAATTGIEGTERPCIVKTVRRDHIHDGSFLARFLDEARVQSQLNHPGVAQIIEAATDESGEPFTLVEYIEGRSLADVRHRAVQIGVTLTWADAVALTLEVAQALAHVHERAGAEGQPLGIVHRDLSPQNVMVGYAGDVKLIDFGTARGQNRRCHTVAGVVFAKPGYVAPEVARHEVGDGRIDLYALGIMLWELCADRRFFVGDPQKHLEEAAEGKLVVPALAEKLGAPELLDEVIAKLTANQPDDRYASASRAASDLARVLSSAPAARNGERGVRTRIASLMAALWPKEPARSRAEFARLLRESRAVRKEVFTPSGTRVIEAATQCETPAGHADMLAGTPYKIVSTIGEGASGVVYEAEHVELGRKVALKVLSPEHASATAAIDRFRREARAIARLSHPNLVALYDFGKSLDGRVFLAMELLNGETLEARIKEAGAIDWQEAVTIAIEIAKALEAAHGAALVHRDLKPANLFLTNKGGVKLLDFGVAMAVADTVLDAKEERQKGFAIFGTPEYMAPEQCAGETVDGRCDLYAFGCVLYEMLTGTRVFEDTSAVAVMGRQLRDFAEPMRTRAPARTIPAALDMLVMRALAKSPDERMQSASEFRNALEDLLNASARRKSRSRRVAGAVLTAACALAAAGISARWGFGTAGDGPSPLSSPLAHAMVAPAAEAASKTTAPVAVETHILSASIANNATAAAPVVETKTTAATATAANRPMVIAPIEIAVATNSLNASPPDYKQAMFDARKFAQVHMTDPRALRAWAHAAYRAGDYREARRATEMWMLLDGTGEPQFYLTTILETMNRRTEAKTVISEWLQTHPDSAEGQKRLAKLNGEGSPKTALAKLGK